MKKKRLLSLILFGVCLSALLGEEEKVQAQSVHAFSDIQVIASDQHFFGQSGVQVVSDGVGQVVKIAPEIHVHKNFFSGAREIQGPLISGGPTVVVARHPKTNEQMYLEVSLPPGAPKIAYCKNKIEYVFPKQRIAIKFSSAPFGNKSNASVCVTKGQGLFRNVKSFAASTNSAVKSHFENSSLANSTVKIGEGAGKLANGVVEAGATGSSKLLDSMNAFANKLPLVQPLKSLVDSKSQRQATTRIDALQRKRTAEAIPFFKTNR